MNRLSGIGTVLMRVNYHARVTCGQSVGNLQRMMMVVRMMRRMRLPGAVLGPMDHIRTVLVSGVAVVVVVETATWEHYVTLSAYTRR